MQGVIELIATTGEAMACRALGTTRGELRRQRLRALASQASWGHQHHARRALHHWP